LHFSRLCLSICFDSAALRARGSALTTPARSAVLFAARPIFSMV